MRAASRALLCGLAARPSAHVAVPFLALLLMNCGREPQRPRGTPPAPHGQRRRGAICCARGPRRKPHTAGSGGTRPRAQPSVCFRLNTPLGAEGDTQESEAEGPAVGPPVSGTLTCPASQGAGLRAKGRQVTPGNASYHHRGRTAAPDVLPLSSGPVCGQSAPPGRGEGRRGGPSLEPGRRAAQVCGDSCLIGFAAPAVSASTKGTGCRLSN